MHEADRCPEVILGLEPRGFVEIRCADEVEANTHGQGTGNSMLRARSHKPGHLRGVPSYESSASWCCTRGSRCPEQGMHVVIVAALSARRYDWPRQER